MDFDDVWNGLRTSAKWTGEAATLIMTAGGSASLERSVSAYEKGFCTHEASAQTFKLSEARFRLEADLLGTETSESIRLLTDADDLVERLSYSLMRSDIRSFPAFAPPNICIARETIARFDAAVTVGQGTGLGVATSTGAWMLVAHLGTASTGAAISGLAGVAAHNAILAWFGGGALAAGGGGMAFGAFAVGGLVALPLVAFSSYKSYKESYRLDDERKKVEEATTKNAQSSEEFARLELKAVDLKKEVIRIRSAFTSEYKYIREEAYRLARLMAASANSFASELTANSLTRGTF